MTQEVRHDKWMMMPTHTPTHIQRTSLKRGNTHGNKSVIAKLSITKKTLSL